MTKNGKIRHNYTIVELLVVIMIMAILFGAASGSFSKMFISQGVIGAVRNVSSKLNLARSYAVSRNRYVALLIPDKAAPGSGLTSGLPTDYENYLYSKTRLCYVKATTTAGVFNFDGWVEGMEWEDFPAQTTAYLANSSGFTAYKVKTVPLTTSASPTFDCASVVFKPAGVLYNCTDAKIKVMLAFYDTNASALKFQKQEDENKGWDISINGYTGRGSYEKKH